MADTRKLVVRVPALPDGEPVEVLFLGLHPNGSTISLDDAQVALYETLTGRTFPKSNYIVIGEAKTDAEKKAVEANAKESEALVDSANQPESTPGTVVPATEEVK